jgi:osmotically-inducible protein OsmY
MYINSSNTKLFKVTKFMLIGLALFNLNGCAPLLLAGAAGGIAVVADRRTTGTVIEDKAIELKASNKLQEYEDISKLYNVSITSYNERVLLIGEAASERVKNKIENIVKEVSKVKTIYNEIRVTSQKSKFTTSSYDSWLTTKVKTSLTTDSRVNPLDIKVTTSGKVVYLMGLVSQKEAEVATEVARSINGVNKVVKLFEYIQPEDEENFVVAKCAK